jgi:hypothetical protein
MRLLKYQRTADTERLGGKIKHVDQPKMERRYKQFLSKSKRKAASTSDTQSILNPPYKRTIFSTGTRQQSPLLLFSRKGLPTTTYSHSSIRLFTRLCSGRFFFLFWRVKEELMDLSLGADSLKESLVAVIRTFTGD